jgi:integrase
MNTTALIQRVNHNNIVGQHTPALIVPFESYIESRERTRLHSDKLPPYLLLPEVNQLLRATLDDRHRILFDFIWHTGARVTEALAIRPKDLMLDGELNSYASLVTLKRGPQRANVKPKESRRLVPITDQTFILALQRYIKSNKIKQLSRLFDLTRQAALKAIVKWTLTADLDLDVTPHTLRHSYAINHLLHGQQLYNIKAWLGHQDIKSTEVYLQVLGSDTSHLAVRTRYRQDLLPTN